MPTSTPHGPAYHAVERLHLRQWALRVVPPLAALATNGSGWIDLPGLPRHDAPLRALGAGTESGAAIALGTLAAGAALVLTAAGLRVLAKAVLVRKTTVTTAGVYGLVRHPFYLATLLGALGVFTLAGPLGVLVALAWFVPALPLFLVTIAGEERGLRSLHGAAWDEYAARVPPLLPLPLPGRIGPPGPDHDTWANLTAEGEPPRLLRFLAGALAVAAVRLGGTTGAVLAAAAAALYAGSRFAPRPSRRGGRREGEVPDSSVRPGRDAGEASAEAADAG